MWKKKFWEIFWKIEFCLKMDFEKIRQVQHYGYIAQNEKRKTPPSHNPGENMINLMLGYHMSHLRLEFSNFEFFLIFWPILVTNQGWVKRIKHESEAKIS